MLRNEDREDKLENCLKNIAQQLDLRFLPSQQNISHFYEK